MPAARFTVSSPKVTRSTETPGLGRLLELIERERADDRPVFVAVDGRSGAGKSHLAARLAATLSDLALVHMDDFYRELPAQRRRELSPREGVDRFFDWQRLRREALEPLRAGRAAAFHPYDWGSVGCSNHELVELPPAPYVAIEGVYSARAEFQDLLDVTVLVRVDDATRRERLAARHDPPSLAERWEAAESFYFERLRPAESFTFVIDGVST